MKVELDIEALNRLLAIRDDEYYVYKAITVGRNLIIRSRAQLCEDRDTIIGKVEG